MSMKGPAAARLPSGVSVAGADQRNAHEREPLPPIPFPGWRHLLWQTYEKFSNDRILSVAAGVTFYALLAVFPAIATVVSLYALVADATTIEGHLTGLAGILPQGAIDVIGGQLHRIAGKGHTALGFSFLFGLAFSLWSANAGTKALFDALNVAYEEREKRSFLALNVTSLVFTLGAIVFAILALGIIVVVPLLLDFFGLKSATNQLIAIMRWPALIGVAELAISVLYRFGPSRNEPRWRWISWGSGVAAVAWLVISAGFSWYTTNFGSYNETYGSLGAAIGFLTWIWLSVTVVLLGAELNAELERPSRKPATA
jgi:membrane protein